MFQLALPLDFAVTSEGKTRHAPLLFSPFSTASCAQARSPFPWKFTPFRLRCAPRGTVVPLQVTLGKSAILPRFITLFWVQRHAATRLTRKNSHFPPALRSVRNSRPAQRYVRLSIYNICAKSYALPLLFVDTERIGVQRHAAAFHVRSKGTRVCLSFRSCNNYKGTFTQSVPFCRPIVGQSARAGDGSACDFGQRCRRQYLPYCQGAFVQRRA